MFEADGLLLTPRVQTRLGLGLLVFTVSIALLGGVFGILGAFFQEIRSYNLLLPFAGGPMIEEAMKPAGVYLLLLRWPQLLRGRIHIAVLAALGGIAFGLVESLVYVKVYVDDPSSSFILYRFTVTIALHAIASFTVGLGLSRTMVDWANGTAKFPKRTRKFYVYGVLIHAAYNIAVTILSLTGDLRFD
ncbi:MAG TPA: PrsW family glutamic-type intramembrane protease [Dehalococcoidia bacterium]|nr:PrsW family glutamic-type intramembrane protease [Dehalococcoidia bacterium]